MQGYEHGLKVECAWGVSAASHTDDGQGSGGITGAYFATTYKRIVIERRSVTRTRCIKIAQSKAPLQSQDMNDASLSIPCFLVFRYNFEHALLDLLT